jgi:hypothetical protein
MPAQRNVYATWKWLQNRFSGGSGTAPEFSIDNNKMLPWRNAANSGDVNVIGMDSSNITQLPNANGTNAAGPVALASTLTVTGAANFPGGATIAGVTAALMQTPASNNNAGNNVIPPTSIVNAVYLRNQAGTARTDTTDTAANIVAVIPGAQNGTRFSWIVWNVGNAANALTISGGTNVTLANVGTVANNTTKEFIGVVTNNTVAAVTIYPT